MGIIHFLTERIADDLSEAPSPQRRREALAKYKILEIHQRWPVLIEGPMNIGVDPTSNPNMFATQQIEWLTQQEYIKRFGTQPPTAPIVLALAAIYCDHPDYDPEWVTT